MEIEQPLISCIMPTYNRREFVPHAIRYFQRQTYPFKELIIIDDGQDQILDLLPGADNIRYIRLDKKITLGAKLNMACEMAKGSIIANWDDDDWYADRRLQYQAEAMQNQTIEMCGINRLFYFDMRDHSAYEYIYPKTQRVWLIGSSQCYRKSFWNLHRFADIDVGMDGLFVWSTTPDKVTVLQDHSISVHMIHNRNVSPKHTNNSWWHPYQADSLMQIMGEDAAYYQLWNQQFPDVPQAVLADNAVDGTGEKPLRNIYACLVHENQETVIDLVQNLHYHDPESQIILYNGGNDTNLLKGAFPFDKFNACAYPNPIPMKYGYLHNFALHCMEFALNNYAFDCLTIVDSDQLAIRSGYPAYLKKSLPAGVNIGMLSSDCKRILPDAPRNNIAIRAYTEYELWEPLLKTFNDGESKFVYWTFWPSTVFMFDAIRDLVKLFKENQLLTNIMRQTQIWATEEVILPTMVSLLGYEIIDNPCSYEFVKYRIPVTNEKIDKALQLKDGFWVHPVRRDYNDPIRARIRLLSDGYQKPGSERIGPYNLLPAREYARLLIAEVAKIQGWLSEAEAGLLMNLTLKVFNRALPVQNLVEIGSYHGKATVLFACTIKKFKLQAKVYAIDRHDGKLGSADQGLTTYPPSLQFFKKNISNAGVGDVVEAFAGNSFDVEWNKPIALLFIDGLHDYKNVLADFVHFSQWIIPGGYVAFHDYSDHFPGVKRFVDELLQTGIYIKANIIDSLIILWKNNPAPPLPERLPVEQKAPLTLQYKPSVPRYLQAMVKVFFHVACMNNWKPVFIEIMEKLYKNGFNHINLTVLGTGEDLEWVYQTAATFNMNINVLFHENELTNFEKPAMLAIEKFAAKNDGYVLYLHTKGVSNPGDATKAKWRRLMLAELVDKCAACIAQLPNHDAIGVNWRELPPTSHFCGNFWYASTKYLRTLADFANYYDNPRYQIWDSISAKRLGCEFWMGSYQKPPKMLSLHCKDVDFCDAKYWDNYE